jgi:hypothetical protein
MFQFPAFAAAGQASRLLVLPTRGLPHSEIAGLTGMCPSPALIAAYRVLRRLSDPRHPPCALAYFAFVTLLIAEVLSVLPRQARYASFLLPLTSKNVYYSGV